jgi:hypothetical protein
VESKVIKTDAGHLELISPTLDQISRIARYWPTGLLERPDAPGRFRLVFQRGDREQYGLKFQPVDMAATHAKAIHHMHCCSIAAALPYYLERQHRGVMIPCAYYKEKVSGLVEAGIAYFVGPDTANPSTSPESVHTHLDGKLGNGALAMVGDMARALVRASKECGAPFGPFLSMEIGRAHV